MFGKKALLFTIALASQLPAVTYAIPQAEVGELQFHKIDQLVASKKISDGFVNHLKALKVNKLSATDYQVTFSQESDADQPGAAVTILATSEGKAKSFTESRAPVASSPVNWGGAAPLDVFEKAVEYIVDTTSDPRLVPFREGLVSAEISPAQTQSGLQATVTAKAGAQDGTLLILVDLSGKILNVDLQK